MSNKSRIELSHLMPVLDIMPRTEAKEFLDDLYGTFNEQMEPLISELQQALERQDQEQLRGVVHFIAGSASNMGMVKLSKLCRNAEKATKSRTFESFETFRADFDKELATGREGFQHLIDSYLT